jgi:hypothetical protein
MWATFHPWQTQAGARERRKPWGENMLWWIIKISPRSQHIHFLSWGAFNTPEQGSVRLCWVRGRGIFHETTVDISTCEVQTLEVDTLSVVHGQFTPLKSLYSLRCTFTLLWRQLPGKMDAGLDNQLLLWLRPKPAKEERRGTVNWCLEC